MQRSGRQAVAGVTAMILLAGFALLTAAIGGAMASIVALCVMHSALRPPPG